MSDLLIAPHLQFPNVLCITFNRPDKKNALTQAMYEQMTLALQEANTNPDIRAVMFTGSSNCFSSGNDIHDFMQATPETLRGVVRFLKTLVTFEKPLVASVEGMAIGIGTTMLLHCDFVYSTHHTHFAVPFVQLGLCPEAASSFLLPNRIGVAKANEMLLLGHGVSGLQAAEIHLINGSYEDALALKTQIDSVLAKLVKLPANALKTTKQLMKSSSSHHQAALLGIIDAECGQFLQCLHSEEAKKAFKAFLAS